jgi:hypothetical protein
MVARFWMKLFSWAKVSGFTSASATGIVCLDEVGVDGEIMWWAFRITKICETAHCHFPLKMSCIVS